MVAAKSSRNSIAASAAFRALAVWLAIHVVISQVLVIVRWNATPTTTNTTTNQKDEEEEDLLLVLEEPRADATAAATTATRTALDEYDKEVMDHIITMIENIQEMDSRQQEMVPLIRKQLNELEKRVMAPLSKGSSSSYLQQETTSSSSSSSSSGTTKSLESLQELLQLPTLSTVHEDLLLLELWNRVSLELNVICHANATVDWSHVAKVVTARYPRPPITTHHQPRHDDDDHLDDSNPTTCITPSPTSATTTTTRYAHESELYQKFNKLQSLLDQRTKLVPPILSSKTDQLQTFLQGEVTLNSNQEQQQQRRQQHSTRLNHDHHCVSREEITNMVEVGLDALQRHLDLRRVLKKHVVSLFPTIDQRKLILDAVLEEEHIGNNKKETNSDFITIRRLLDTTPLLWSHHGIAQWIDQGFDAMGGYHDGWDRMVDRLAASSPHSSVGQTMIAAFLHYTGHLYIPNFWNKVPSNAGILKQV